MKKLKKKNKNNCHIFSTFYRLQMERLQSFFADFLHKEYGYKMEYKFYLF